MRIGRIARRSGGIEMITLAFAVLGHEQTGIPPEAVELLDVAVEIPMVGSGASLNVAVAGSLVLYRLAGLI
jgi:tRNA (guanosine-2'-O-)-methyltransferase